MKPMCKDCGQYEALSWSSKGLCLRCWFKPGGDDDTPPAGVQLEIEDDERTADMIADDIQAQLDYQDPPLDMPWLWDHRDEDEY